MSDDYKSKGFHSKSEMKRIEIQRGSSGPREFWIEINETLDMNEECESGLAFTLGFLEEMEMTGYGMIRVIEKSYADLLERKLEIAMAALELIAGSHEQTPAATSFARMACVERALKEIGEIK